MQRRYVPGAVGCGSQLSTIPAGYGGSWACCVVLNVLLHGRYCCFRCRGYFSCSCCCCCGRFGLGYSCCCCLARLMFTIPAKYGGSWTCCVVLHVVLHGSYCCFCCCGCFGCCCLYCYDCYSFGYSCCCCCCCFSCRCCLCCCCFFCRCEGGKGRSCPSPLSLVIPWLLLRGPPVMILDEGGIVDSSCHNRGLEVVILFGGG